MTPVPKDESILDRVRAAGPVDTHVQQVIQIRSRTDLWSDQKVERLREEIQTPEALEETDIRMCVARAQKQITTEIFDAWRNDYAEAIAEAIRQETGGVPPAASRLLGG